MMVVSATALHSPLLIIQESVLLLRLGDLYHLLPAGFIRADISARHTILEFENDLSSTLSLLMNPVSEDCPAIKRGFQSLFMKINFAPDQFLCLFLIQLPQTAFPHIVLQLHKMIHGFYQVYVHVLILFLVKPPNNS